MKALNIIVNTTLYYMKCLHILNKGTRANEQLTTRLVSFYFLENAAFNVPAVEMM